MDFDQYVAARYGRLIEHAVLLGVAEGEAGPVVDRVLIAERRQIRRAKDPDPAVREALAREVRGEPVRRRRNGPIAAVALVVGLALIGVVATYQPAPAEVTMPSLFGYNGPRATAYLRELGLEVEVDKVRGCEPLGQVIGSSPEPGDPAQEGATVIVRTALPSDSFCLPDYDDRVEAWAFIGFALGGKPPAFATAVTVVQAASSESADAQPAAVRTLDPSQAGDRSAWGEVLEQVARASSTRVTSVSRMAVLDVDSLVPPAQYCSRVRPPQVTDRAALRLTIDTTGDGNARCPLTVDLYRSDDGSIDSVVFYPAA